MDPAVLAELEQVDCYDDEEDLGALEAITVGLDTVDELAGRVDLHDWAARRGALDRHAAQFGLDAVNELMVRGLAQTAGLPGRTVAVVPDELARFMQADDAYWVHLMCGQWFDHSEVCGAARRDELGELEEWCMLPPHPTPGGHGWDRRAVAVTW